MKSIQQEKQSLRNLWKNKVTFDQESRQRFSRKISEQLAETSVLRNAKHIGLYSARDWEVDLSFVWAKRPGQCFYPKTIPQTIELHFFPVQDLSELNPAYAGILEPKGNTPRLVDWKDTDVVLVPGVCFDRNGGRIGYGKGYYDRFLATLPKGVKKWGVCFSQQISDAFLPLEPTDIRLDNIVSEKGFLRLD